MPAKRYRKKPVVVEALQWTGGNKEEIRDFANEDVFFSPAGLRIRTLEGTMTASQGDFIIKGVLGEFYPCKPEVFESSYMPADAP